MLVVIRDRARGWVTLCPTPWERVLCRFRGHRLDRALATGEPPESDVLLSLRADLDVAMSRRLQTAATLRRLVQDATKPPRYVHRGTPTLQRHRICTVRHEMDLLIGRLERPGPLPAAGIAQIRLLLSDGGGPLYYEGSNSDLRQLLTTALVSLDAPLTS